MSRDLLFEIGTEELPAWYVTEGSRALGPLLEERLRAAGLAPVRVTVYGTPRRLAALATGLPERSEERVEERRGPSAAVAFDDAGAPTRAAEAFARSAGVPVASLERRQTERGEYVYARVVRGGEPAAAVLPALLAGVVADLPAPRKMRWGEVDTPFVRPVAWLTARLGDEVVPVAAAGHTAGGASRGHRFLAPGAVELAAPGDYAASLRGAWVIAAEDERREETLRAVGEAAAAEGLGPVVDASLLAEVANLVEWPFPIVGRFDDEYLELPDEVLTTVMVKHQRFFPLRAPDGRLAARFVGVANNRVPDEGVVRRGYEDVLAGRLYDARFFWRADRERSLSQLAWALSGIAFQRDLGSMADKTARVSSGAEAVADAVALGEEDRRALAGALPLFRADLASQMVYEFPELEGDMARAYALAEGQPPAVADVLRDGVRPKGPEAPLPLTEPGAVLAVADRLDKLVGFFALGKRPSGSADPFGLRRDAHGVVRVLADRGWRASVETLVEAAAGAYRDGPVTVDMGTIEAVAGFVWDRVAALLEEQGYPTTVVRAATLGSATVLGALRRARLLAHLMTRPEFADLMALYKRAANLAERYEPEDPEAEPRASVDPGMFVTDEEGPLYEALDEGASGAAELLAAAATAVPPHDPARDAGSGAPFPADVEAPLARLLGLKAPLDAYLDNVLVMAEDERVRRNRLALLAAVVAPLRRLGALEHLA
ncbi:MAG TPA: glycine--tRNA ligase subunit beta [Trueperaceae bacterium]